MKDCDIFENIQRRQEFYSMKFDLNRFLEVTTSTELPEVATTVSTGNALFP
ncbi:unnamed protein product, partial [Rotaria sp. Silwood2]